jgi:hypothetical protein
MNFHGFANQSLRFIEEDRWTHGAGTVTLPFLDAQSADGRPFGSSVAIHSRREA